MIHRTATARLISILAMSGLAAAPAAAYKWPGENAALGSAIAAKVIGKQCVGTLSASDMREIDAYLEKSADELARKPDARKYAVNGVPFHETVTQRLTETYTKKYSEPADMINAIGWAATDVADAILRKTPNPTDFAAVKKWLESNVIESIHNQKFSSTSHVGVDASSVLIVELKDNTWVPAAPAK